MKRRLPPRRLALVGAMVIGIVAGTPAVGRPATLCTDICPSGTPCTISNAKSIVPGSRVDCSGIDIELLQFGKLQVTDGSFAVLAHSIFSTNANSQIEAVASGGGQVGGIRIEVETDFSFWGGVRADSAGPGGSVEIVAGRDILIPDQGEYGISVTGTGTGAPGGDIQLSAGRDIVLGDPLITDCAGSGEANAGNIGLWAGGQIVTSGTGELRAESRSTTGGAILLNATGNINVGAPVSANGRQDHGDGGNIGISSTAGVTIGAALTARGGVNAGGDASSGGDVQIGAGCGGITVGSTIDVRSGDAGAHDGGMISLEAHGPVTLNSTALMDLRSTQPAGIAGTFVASSDQTLKFVGGAKVDARGDASGHGRGGEIDLQGCVVTVEPSATFDVTAYEGGRIWLQARTSPTATGVQPMTIREGSQLVANTNSGAQRAGAIWLDPVATKPGVCSTQMSLACSSDSQCPAVGCNPGHCLYANPDTDGVWSQFSIIPTVHSTPSLPKGCSTTCVQ